MPSDSKRIDPAAREVLRSLQAEGEPDIYLKLVEVFLQSSDMHLQTMKNLLAAEGDSKRLKDVGHTWRSSAAAVGATALSELCLQLEINAHARNNDVVVALIKKITDEYSAVKSELTGKIKAA